MTRRALPALLLLLLVFLGGSARASGDMRTAVLYFDNQGNEDLAMLKLGLAQMLIAQFSAEPGVAVLERYRLNEILAELELQKTGAVDPGTAAKIGKLLGVERMVLGGYFELMGRFQLSGRVVEVETGRVLGSASRNGAVSDFAGLLQGLGDDLLPYLAGGKADGSGGGAAPTQTGAAPKQTGAATRPARAGAGDPATPTTVTRAGGATQPDAAVQAPAANPAATRTAGPEGAAESAGDPPASPATPADPLAAALAFSEGLDYLDRKDLERARTSLRRAVELDPALGAARDELARISL
jgi:TolB-like protein